MPNFLENKRLVVFWPKSLNVGYPNTSKVANRFAMHEQSLVNNTTKMTIPTHPPQKGCTICDVRLCSITQKQSHLKNSGLDHCSKPWTSHKIWHMKYSVLINIQSVAYKRQHMKWQQEPFCFTLAIHMQKCPIPSQLYHHRGCKPLGHPQLGSSIKNLVFLHPSF